MAKIYPSGYGKIIWKIPGPNKASDAIITSDYELLTGPTTPAPTPEQVTQAIAVRADAAAALLFTARLGVGWSYTGAKVTYKLLSTEYGAEINRSPAIVGANAAPSPPQVAVVVRKTSSLVGRRFKGRFYVPGILIDSAVDDAGLLIPGTVTSLQTAFSAFQSTLVIPATLTEAQIALAIVHSPPKSGVVTPPPNRVLALSVQALTATQRRRIR
jgi:hypothetical protein